MALEYGKELRIGDRVMAEGKGATVEAYTERLPRMFHGPYAVAYTDEGERIPKSGWLATACMAKIEEVAR